MLHRAFYDHTLPRVLTDKNDKKSSRREPRNLLKNKGIARALEATEDRLSDPALSTLVIYPQLHQHFQDNGVKTLPEWRRLTDKTKAILYHLAMKRLAARDGLVVVPFTFNLSRELIQSMRTDQRGCAAKLRKNVKQQLQRATGRDVPYFFQVEVAVRGCRGRPHVHGELLLTREEATDAYRKNPAKQALHGLNTYQAEENFKRFALRFDTYRCDAGWPQYLTKHLNISSLYVDDPLKVSRECTMEARKLWDDLRDQSKLYRSNNYNPEQKAAKNDPEAFQPPAYEPENQEPLNDHEGIDDKDRYSVPEALRSETDEDRYSGPGLPEAEAESETITHGELLKLSDFGPDSGTSGPMGKTALEAIIEVQNEILKKGLEIKS
ncbi:hypothetical protein [Neptuniibacter sp.]|uniref:hypothetical protein n=1 Tax=Neptuniibacter sp. TaxID=1962643 RepID=UPI0026275E70|nr:hypothetical protein [Neptuniibacter sp.]MCP4597188.1 hypothetical protein [Neptuniibacter sp.]